MVKAKKYVVKKYFQGVPKKTDYEIVEFELPPLKDGEILVKAEWISVDPYLRAYVTRHIVPYDQYGYQVGTVLESKASEYPAGIRVVSHKGWCTYSVIDVAKKADPLIRLDKLPNLGNLSPSLAIGAVGMPGVAAYLGLLDICQPKTGETVVVTSAAGAVGSLVGQIAKIKGCKVIGFTGSDEKVKWLETELGFDKAINYKTANIAQTLKEAAPQGVDCYFDNVGGELSSQIVLQMNPFGRVAACGSISAYNDDITKLSKATMLQMALVFQQLKIEGFIVKRWVGRWPEAFEQIIKWINSGQLKTREHITEGFDNIFEAFIGMLAGENTGKAIVKI